MCNLFGCREASPTLSTGLTTSTNSQTKSLVGQTASNARKMSKVAIAAEDVTTSSELRQPLCSQNSSRLHCVTIT
jgi:hypothetical protein